MVCPNGRGAGRRRRGFTLIEIMVVLFIFAVILAAVVFIGRKSIGHREVDGTANELKGGLSYARSLSLNGGGAELRLEGVAPVFTGFSIVDGQGEVQKRFEIPRTVRVTANPAATTIGFKQNGGLTDGTIGAASELVLTVSNAENDFFRRVTVRKTTGSVEVAN